MEAFFIVFNCFLFKNSLLGVRAQNFILELRGTLQLDGILLPIFQFLTDSDEKDEVPYWLEKAIFQFSGAEDLQEGGEQFLKDCNRSNAHVNRTIKKIYNITLTKFVNEIRLKRAKEQLMVTNYGIKTIAHSVGFNDVSYFHKLFKLHYSITPTAFRKKNALTF